VIVVAEAWTEDGSFLQSFSHLNKRNETGGRVASLYLVDTHQPGETLRRKTRWIDGAKYRGDPLGTPDSTGIFITCGFPWFPEGKNCRIDREWPRVAFQNKTRGSEPEKRPGIRPCQPATGNFHSFQPPGGSFLGMANGGLGLGPFLLMKRGRLAQTTFFLIWIEENARGGGRAGSRFLGKKRAFSFFFFLVFFLFWVEGVERKFFFYNSTNPTKTRLTNRCVVRRWTSNPTSGPKPFYHHSKGANGEGRLVFARSAHF